MARSIRTLLLMAGLVIVLAAPAEAHRHRKELVAPNCAEPATNEEKGCCTYPSTCRSRGFTQPTKAELQEFQKEFYEDRRQRTPEEQAAIVEQAERDAEAALEANRRKLKCRKAQTRTEHECCDSGDPALCHRLGFQTPNEFSEKGKLAAASPAPEAPELEDPKCEVMSLANDLCCERRTKEICEPRGFKTPD